MGVTSVRFVEDNSPLSERLGETLDTQNIRFEFHDRNISDPDPNISDCPFDEIDVIDGDFHYESEPLFGSPTTANGEFEIRVHSDLFLIEYEQDRPKPEKIFTSFRRLFDNLFDGEVITERFRPNRKSIRRFVERADQVIELRVLMPSGKVNKVSIDEVEINEYPIDSAKLRFSREKESGDEEAATVLFVDDQIRVGNGSVELNEYIIQQFESAMFYTN